MVLTKESFEPNVAVGAWFVMFYAPWCEHCKAVEPVWASLAKEAHERGLPVTLAKVECPSAMEVCHAQGVQGLVATFTSRDRLARRPHC